MAYFPTTEDVAVAWLRLVNGLDPTKVATTLPADTSAWAATGFVQVSQSLPGAPAVETPLYGPVVVVDCWAAAVGSGRPPWGQAGALASAIEWATHSGPRQVVLDIRPGYHPARLMTVTALGAPVRVTLDEASYARYQIELQLRWTPWVAA